jgi:hypothetical protein
MHRCRTLLLFFLVLTAEAQWPRFRGPNGSGVDGADAYPVEFSPSKNVMWKASVPYGQSSPIIMGNRVYLTASTEDKLLMICLRGSGAGGCPLGPWARSALRWLTGRHCW